MRVTDNDGSNRPAHSAPGRDSCRSITDSLPSALRCGQTAKTLCEGSPCSESSSETTGPTTGSSRMRNRPFPRVPHHTSFVFSDWIARTYRASMLGIVRLHSPPFRQRKTPLPVANHNEPSGVRAIDLTAGPFSVANAGSSVMVFPSDENTPSLAVPIKSRSSPSASRLITSRAVAGVLDQPRLRAAVFYAIDAATKDREIRCATKLCDSADAASSIRRARTRFNTREDLFFQPDRLSWRDIETARRCNQQALRLIFRDCIDDVASERRHGIPR